LKHFDQNKSFKTWIFTIAKRVCIDFIKKKKTIPLSVFDHEEGENAVINGLTDPSPLAEEISERRDLASKISSAMAQLLPKYRTVLSLYYNDRYNFREIAEISDESVNTIKSRHRRGLVLLQKLLGDTEP
jgi:RNA polymerase sigma-70 factor (ECF subfamily)